MKNLEFELAALRSERPLNRVGFRAGMKESRDVGEPPAVQGAKNLDSCFRRNDNVAVAATAKHKTLGEIQGYTTSNKFGGKR